LSHIPANGIVALADGRTGGGLASGVTSDCDEHAERQTAKKHTYPV